MRAGWPSVRNSSALAWYSGTAMLVHVPFWAAAPPRSPRRSVWHMKNFFI